MNVSYVNRSVNVVSAREKLEHSVGVEVVVGVITILAEGEAWLTRTGVADGLSGSDIVLSGPHSERTGPAIAVGSYLQPYFFTSYHI